jgi:bifunctional non-homologous end joining protein LigD
VALFDTGVWSTPYDAEAQLAKGHLRFELFGKKLKGGWHLVRSGKPRSNHSGFCSRKKTSTPAMSKPTTCSPT